MRFSTAFTLLLALPLGLAVPTSDNVDGTVCFTASQASLQKEKSKFAAAGLTPTYIGSFNPTVLAGVTYTLVLNGTNGVGTGIKRVDYGNEFKSIETLVQPTVYITKEKDQPAATTYSVFFINFDNPNSALPPAAHLPFLHWQESGLTACNIAPGSQTQFFIPSFPTQVGEQRYTFLIFREPKGYVANPALTATRVLTNISSFAASQNLTLVGGNYFLEGQENNVPPT